MYSLTDFPADQLDSISPSAHAAASIYPIITLEKPYAHTSRHRMLLENHADPEEESPWSLQNMVSRHTPPMFLVQSEDDTISNPENTLIMKSACDRANVPVELYRYAWVGTASVWAGKESRRSIGLTDMKLGWPESNATDEPDAALQQWYSMVG